jgi:hypothetical protein
MAGVVCVFGRLDKAELEQLVDKIFIPINGNTIFINPAEPYVVSNRCERADWVWTDFVLREQLQRQDVKRQY